MEIRGTLGNQEGRDIGWGDRDLLIFLSSEGSGAWSGGSRGEALLELSATIASRFFLPWRVGVLTMNILTDSKTVELVILDAVDGAAAFLPGGVSAPTASIFVRRFDVREI